MWYGGINRYSRYVSISSKCLTHLKICWYTRERQKCYTWQSVDGWWCNFALMNCCLCANDGITLAFQRFIKAPDPTLYSFDLEFGAEDLSFEFQSPVSSEKVSMYAFSQIDIFKWHWSLVRSTSTVCCLYWHYSMCSLCRTFPLFTNCVTVVIVLC